MLRPKTYLLLVPLVADGAHMIASGLHMIMMYAWLSQLELFIYLLRYPVCLVHEWLLAVGG